MEKTQLQTQDTTDLRKPKGSTRPPQGNDAKANHYKPNKSNL